MRKIALMIILLLIPVVYSDSAEDIAVGDLRGLYREKGIYAGANQFSDYWARDSLFASLGSNAIGDFNISKHNLELFLRYQKEDGQIPMRVGSYDIIMKLMGLNIQQKPRPRYDQDKMFTKPLDQNCLIVIAAEDYITKSGDLQFARDNLYNLERAIAWLATKDTNGNLLIEEKEYAGWADSVKKKGEVLYTNICYYKALSSLSNIAEQLNDSDKVNSYSLWSQLIKEQINNHFWSGEYYIDWVDDNDVKHTYFSTDGNVLAIVWGVADDNQTENILNYIDEQGFSNGFGVQTADVYERKYISPINTFAGISDYHSNIRWLWLSCFYAKALNDSDREDMARSKINEIKNKIKDDDGVYEVYEPDGSIVDRWFYKSEHPFAWSSGVCIYVFEDMGVGK